LALSRDPDPELNPSLRYAPQMRGKASQPPFMEREEQIPQYHFRENNIFYIKKWDPRESLLLGPFYSAFPFAVFLLGESVSA
jgi:hypothetical protein